MKDYILKNDFKCTERETENIDFEIDGVSYSEQVETVWYENVWDEIIICIEKYDEDTKALCCDDLQFRIKCDIKIQDILSYVRQWDSSTIKIIAVGDKIIQTLIYPNRQIDDKERLMIFEISAGYGDEMFARYDERIGEFVPCGKRIGKKVNKCLAVVTE